MVFKNLSKGLGFIVLLESACAQLPSPSLLAVPRSIRDAFPDSSAVSAGYNLRRDAHGGITGEKHFSLTDRDYRIITYDHNGNGFPESIHVSIRHSNGEVIRRYVIYDSDEDGIPDEIKERDFSRCAPNIIGLLYPAKRGEDYLYNNDPRQDQQQNLKRDYHSGLQPPPDFGCGMITRKK